MKRLVAKQLAIGALAGVLAFTGVPACGNRAGQEAKQRENLALRQELLRFKNERIEGACRLSTSEVLLTLKNGKGVVLQSIEPLHRMSFDARIELTKDKTLFFRLPGEISPDTQQGELTLTTWDGRNQYSSGPLILEVPMCEKGQARMRNPNISAIAAHGNASGDSGILLLGTLFLLM